MTKNPHSLTRRAFFRAAVSLPFIGVAGQPVEETQVPPSYWTEGTSITRDDALAYNESTGMLTLGDGAWGAGVLSVTNGGTGYTTGRLISLSVNERELSSLWSLPHAP